MSTNYHNLTSISMYKDLLKNMASEPEYSGMTENKLHSPEIIDGMWSFKPIYFS